jgi:hypothetical protein
VPATLAGRAVAGEGRWSATRKQSVKEGGVSLTRCRAVQVILGQFTSWFHRTPAHLAIYASHFEIVKLFINHGADLSIVDGYGQSAMDWMFMDPASTHMQKDRDNAYFSTIDAVRISILR